MTDGALYVGLKLDPETGRAATDRLEIPSDHLTTHGVIVGMTGSGKTGLGVVLLEEILSAGVPALILDPKGDMGNLALTFPDFRASDFRPWIDEGEAKREGSTPEELAAETAAKWQSGLSGSGITGSRLASFRESVDVRIYTPGSSAGVGLAVLGDLAAPDVDWDADSETIREEIQGLVSGLLTLAGVDSDPLTSREHILLSNLVEHGWKQGIDLDLPTLLGWIQTPPLRRLGVFEIDAFFPGKDRMALAMRLNGLVASPAFAEWLQGEPLDIERLLWAPDGRPRASVVSLSHLTEEERQFVVTLLLSKMVTWMRQQPGTSELRAAVYIDEIFGMAPPTAEPPSKRPMLTLFKQARAHGVGMVVATQNPVDLDYKIMSNAGTWMVGRLQTARDKMRIIEALQSATGDVDVDAWDERIGDLGKRQFVYKSARSPEPTLFTTRWAMSYLRGPLTRTEITRLRGEDEQPSTRSGGATPRGDAPSHSEATAPQVSGAAQLAADESPIPPKVARGVRVGYLDPGAPWAREIGASSTGSRLRAGLAVRVGLLFDDTKAQVKHTEEWEAVAFPLDGSPGADDLVAVDYDERDFSDEPPAGARFVLPPVPLGESPLFTAWKKDVQEWLYRHRTVSVLRNPTLKLYSRIGESAEAFEERCLARAEDEADAEAEKMRDRIQKRLKTAQRRADDAERKVRELEADVGQRKQHEMVAGAGEVLSMFLGGRRRVRSLSGAASRRGVTRRAEERLRSAREKLEDRVESIAELEEELTEELQEIWEKWEDAAQDTETLEIGLEKSDIRVEDVVLFWAPEG